MADAPEYLADISALDENGEAVTLRVSTCGYVTGPSDTPANAVYEAAISDPGAFSRSLYGQGRTIGQAEVGYGDLVIANADGAFDDWTKYAFDGRSFILRRLPSRHAAFSQAEIVLRATVEGIDSDSGWLSLRLRLYDKRLDLEQPVQTNRYGGTTNSGGATADGTTDLKDTVKPLTFGKVFNVLPADVNPFDLIKQVHDGAVASIQVYDGGVPLTAGSNFTSISALRSATIAPGSFATALSLGLFRLGWSPAGTVTADVVEGSTAASRRPGAIAQRILTKMGISDYDSASFDDLDTAAPYEAGIYIDREMRGADALRQVLESVGAYIIPNADDEFEAGRLTFGTSVRTYTEHDMLTEGAGGTVAIFDNPDTPKNLPAHRVTLNYLKVWEPQRESELMGCVEDDYRAYVGREWRQVSAESSATKTRHPLSEEITFDTLLTSLTDATAEATRRIGFYGVHREVISFGVPQEEAAELGQTVTVVMPRLGYEAGKDMIVIGREEQNTQYRTILTCWG